MKLLPFGVVLGQDDDQALVELINTRWRQGRIPGPVLGRRDHNHTHQEIENCQRLEILWAAAPPQQDYYDGEYDSEAYAHPPLVGRASIGEDYHARTWNDIATTEETLKRLRAELRGVAPSATISGKTILARRPRYGAIVVKGQWLPGTG
jgi:hypothetical protein